MSSDRRIKKGGQKMLLTNMASQSKKDSQAGKSSHSDNPHKKAINFEPISNSDSDNQKKPNPIPKVDPRSGKPSSWYQKTPF